MFDFLFKPSQEWGTGALFDQRPLGARGGDINIRDVVASVAKPMLVEKKSSQWRVFPKRNQGQGNSCMANAGAKALGIAEYMRDGKFVEFSAAHIYQRRENKPAAGMAMYDLLDVMGRGVTLEALVPSNELTDPMIDTIKLEPHEVKVGEIFAGDVPVNIDSGDFDTVASTIQRTGKGVVIMLYFNSAEYSALMPRIKDPTLNPYAVKTLRHGITAVDAFLYNGKPALLCEDSAWFGGYSQRIITQEFYEVRNFGAGYPLRFKYDAGAGARPVYDGSIKSAQRCMQYEGFFPVNIPLAETVGPTTKAALARFQAKYELPITQELDAATIARIRQIYGA